MGEVGWHAAAAASSTTGGSRWCGAGAETEQRRGFRGVSPCACGDVSSSIAIEGSCCAAGRGRGGCCAEGLVTE